MEELTKIVEGEERGRVFITQLPKLGSGSGSLLSAANTGPNRLCPGLGPTLAKTYFGQTDVSKL